MATQHTTAFFQVQKSPCCRHRARVQLGNKKLCLSWPEAQAASKLLKQVVREIRCEIQTERGSKETQHG